LKQAMGISPQYLVLSYIWKGIELNNKDKQIEKIKERR